MLYKGFTFEDIFRDSEKIMNNVVKSTFRTIDDLSVEELQRALDKKSQEKMKKSLRMQQAIAKVKTILREDVVFTIDEASIGSYAVVDFTTASGEKGSLRILLENGQFFK